MPNVIGSLALCKLHHVAFDSFMISVSPDYIIHVRRDVLEEDDGPMLQQQLKELHQARIIPDAPGASLAEPGLPGQTVSEG